MADPMSLVVATAAAQAVELVGLPEAGLNLSQAVVHSSLAPKSNSAATACGRPRRTSGTARSRRCRPTCAGRTTAVPRRSGSGIGYEYPHDDPRGYLEQQYLPDELAGRRYYEPESHGAEGRCSPSGGGSGGASRSRRRGPREETSAMKSNADRLRNTFTEFFVERGHLASAPASLIPNDPTVLFTIAGMVPVQGVLHR